MCRRLTGHVPCGIRCVEVTQGTMELETDSDVLGGLLTARWGTRACPPGSEEWLRSSNQGSWLVFGTLELTSVRSEGWIWERSNQLGDCQNHPEGGKWEGRWHGSGNGKRRCLRIIYRNRSHLDKSKKQRGTEVQLQILPWGPVVGEIGGSRGRRAWEGLWS